MNPQPRIAFISEHASPAATRGGQDAGGQNVYVDEVSRSLGSLGYVVDVFTRRDSREVAAVVDWADNVRLVNLPAGPPEMLLKDALWPWMPAFRDALLRLAERDGLRYDVVHANFWMSGWVGMELKRRLDAPLVQIFHAMGKTKRRFQGANDTSPDERIGVEEEIVRQADALIAQCPAERTELTSDYGADPQRVHVIPSAVNVDTFRPVAQVDARRRIGLPMDGPLVVYVGRLLPRKDVRTLVRAVALLNRRGAAGDGVRDVTLLVVGGEDAAASSAATPEIGELERIAADLGVRDRVRFAGHRQTDELRFYYSAADVVATTPWYEPFGLTALEAMACGRPVVASAVGGLAYTIVDGQTGFLVQPRDPAVLAERLYLLLAYPGLRERMGAAARDRVERRFTWPVVARRTSALYQSLLDQKNERDWRHPGTPQAERTGMKKR